MSHYVLPLATVGWLITQLKVARISLADVKMCRRVDFDDTIKLVVEARNGFQHTFVFTGIGREATSKREAVYAYLMEPIKETVL